MRFHVKHPRALAALAALTTTLGACPATPQRPDPAPVVAAACPGADPYDPEVAATAWLAQVRAGQEAPHSQTVAALATTWKQAPTIARSWSPAPGTTHVLFTSSADKKRAIRVTLVQATKGVVVTDARLTAPDELVPGL